MYAILVSGHYPHANQRDIPRNATVKVFLDKAINTQSIDQNNLIITDNMYRPVVGTVGWDTTDAGTPSGVNNILTFTPETYFDPSTTYNVTVTPYPDSVRALDDSYIQQAYRFTFYTGISTLDNTDPTTEEQLQMDLEAAVAREDWCEAARIQAILDGESGTCGIPFPSGINSGVIPDCLKITSTFPSHMDSDVPMEQLRFIKLTFNDEMPASGIEYNSYINVMTKNVLE